MFFSLRSVGYVAMAACALAGSNLLAQSAAAVPKATSAARTLLPTSFSGWVEASLPATGTAPAALDAANADVLNEYGLKDFAQGTYHHGNGRVSVRAMRFPDATGAYGAFTFYRRPDMKPEALGSGGAGDAHEIMFWSGVTFVDAEFARPWPNEESAVRNLAAQLPPAGGSDAVAPSLPQYLPPAGLEASSVHYAIGPAAYTRTGGVLPVALIDFSRDAEAVTAQYQRGTGKGTVTILEYPTFQIAAERAKAIDAMLKGQGPLPALLQQSNTAALAVKSSGPLVAVTSGDMSSDESAQLLKQVRYQADVTWNRGGGSESGEVKNAAKMLIGIAYLTAVLAACAVLLGFFLGGGRALWRVMRGKPISAVYEEDFISLNLADVPSDEARKLP